MFCYKCGTQIPDDSAFCSRCGASVQSVSGEQQEVKTYTVTLDRASQVYLLNPPVKAVIDGKIRLSIDNGKTEQVSLEPGPHKIELSGSFRSTAVDVDLDRDIVIQISFNRISGKLVAEIVK